MRVPFLLAGWMDGRFVCFSLFIHEGFCYHYINGLTTPTHRNLQILIRIKISTVKTT